MFIAMIEADPMNWAEAFTLSVIAICVAAVFIYRYRVLYDQSQKFGETGDTSFDVENDNPRVTN